ncbi:MAG: hypothetical protein HZA46_13595 [Planctomycetales bacterium]|nr:hypothetical protein [Planctomycetales bacterium]
MTDGMKPLMTPQSWAIHRIFFRRIGSIAVAMFLAVGTVTHADDDDDPLDEVAAQAARFEMPENQFESWMFQTLPNASAARAKLEKLLALHTQDVDQACRLSEAQQKKLQLAGRGDIKRFFEQVEVVRRKFLLVRKDQNKVNEIWQDIQPLQLTFLSGLHGPDSFFRKTLRNILNERQFEDYSRLATERQLFQYRAKVELVVSVLEGGLPLRDEQRQRLITTIVEHSQPPRRYGQQDYYVVMWSISKIPEATLKPLFDEAEWKALTRQFAQVRGMEQWLKKNGAIAMDEVEE